MKVKSTTLWLTQWDWCRTCGLCPAPDGLPCFTCAANGNRAIGYATANAAELDPAREARILLYQSRANNKPHPLPLFVATKRSADHAA